METLACTDCGEIFLSLVQLKEHMKTHGELRPYWCDICGATFTQQRSVEKHRQLHRRQQDCRCEICGVQLLTRSGYIAHKRGHKNVEMMQPGFVDPSDNVVPEAGCQAMQSLEKIEVKKKPADFDTDKYFRVIEKELSSTMDSASLTASVTVSNTSSDVRLHSKIHPCPFCPLTCSSADRLQMHIRRLHEGIAPLETCDVCSRKYYGKEYMEKHRRTHASLPDMYPCDQCSKVFKRKWSLETHRKIHTFKKFVQCDICGEEFRFISEVDKHKTAYTNMTGRRLLMSAMSVA